MPGVGSAVDGVRRGVLRLFVATAHRAGNPVAVLVPQLLAARRYVVGKLAAAAVEERARFAPRLEREDRSKDLSLL